MLELRVSAQYHAHISLSFQICVSNLQTKHILFVSPFFGIGIVLILLQNMVAAVLAIGLWDRGYLIMRKYVL